MLGGDFAVNAQKIGGAMFGLLPGGSAGGWVNPGMALLVLALVASVFAIRSTHGAPSRAAARLAFVWLGALGFFVLPLTSRFGSAYYGYVPLAVLGLAMAVALQAGFDAFGPTRQRVRSVCAAVVAVSLAMQVGNFLVRGSARAIRQAERSQHLQAGLERLAREFAPGELGSLTLVRHPSFTYSTFLSKETRRASLWRYFVDPDAVTVIGRRPIALTSRDDVERELQRAAAREEPLAAFGEGMRLRGFTRAGRITRVDADGAR